MTKIAQLWDLIETSSFREDIKDIKYNDDDYNDKEDNNKNNTYEKDNKDYKYVDMDWYEVKIRLKMQGHWGHCGFFGHLVTEIWKFT